MPTTVDLNEVIADSISDAELPLEEPEVASAASDEVPEVAPEPKTTDSEPEAKTGDPAEEEGVEVKSPAAKSEPTKPTDDFEKRFGIPQNSASGRENRIPYSRVTKIVGKAQKETEATIRGEYTPKIADFETKVKDYETKVASYETQIGEVREFEKVMVNDHVAFLNMLITKVPGYAAILAPLYEKPQTQETQTKVEVPDEMPLPDGENGEYTKEGLRALLAWNRAEAKKDALADVNKEYGEIKKERDAFKRMQEAIPDVQAKITAARKWAKFDENEAEIVKALQADETLTLEAAYNQVVVPKLVMAQDASVADRAQLEKDIRAQILKELKAAPKSTSTATSHTKAEPVPVGGKRDLTDVIGEAIKTLK